MPVQVCFNWDVDIDHAILQMGQYTASTILDRINVKLEWSCATSETAHNIQIRLVDLPDSSSSSDALASARPYAKSGVQIQLFYDRLLPFFGRDRAQSGRLFGHVMAHEIGHVLEGVAVHSQQGIMRAHWTSGDFSQMRRHLLNFGDRDARLIRATLSGPLRAASNAQNAMKINQ